MSVLDRTPPTAAHRIHYGPGDSQFGDLWLPATHTPPPLVVFIHGGWWQSEYDLAYAGHLCADLKAHNIATWSIEYRRVGSTGGGWPATFQDVAAAYDYLPTLGRTYPLNLARPIAMGHSAGGHLAFWLAARHHIPASSPLHTPQPTLPLHAVIALAGAVDLALTISLSTPSAFPLGGPATQVLIGGSPSDHPDRYQAADPGQLLPLNLKQFLVQGAQDTIVPPQLASLYAEKARKQGDQVTVIPISHADHFDVVDPQSQAWPTIRTLVQQLTKP